MVKLILRQASMIFWHIETLGVLVRRFKHAPHRYVPEPCNSKTETSMQHDHFFFVGIGPRLADTL